MATFSERLKNLRTVSHLSQEELAKRLKVTRSCIGNYEQGIREPDREDLEKIADYFNVDLDYLLGRTDVEKRASFEQLTANERRMLELYRQDPSVKDVVDRMVAYYSMIGSPDENFKSIHKFKENQNESH